MNRRRFGIAVAGVILTVVSYSLLLLTGGASDRYGSFDDFPDDVPVVEGAETSDATVPDVVGASVESRGEAVVFEARLKDPPRSLGGPVELRWRLTSDSGAWVVSVSLDGRLEASVDPEGAPAMFTRTGTFPGEVGLRGRAVTVDVRPARIRGWPESFRWFLTSTYEPEGVEVPLEDRVPDAGAGVFPAPSR
ncbi:MAG: hypothetical protein ACRDJ5_12000 [Actinomycetota bacterium]